MITVTWVLFISHRSVKLRLWSRDAVFDSREISNVGDGNDEAFPHCEEKFLFANTGKNEQLFEAGANQVAVSSLRSNAIGLARP